MSSSFQNSTVSAIFMALMKPYSLEKQPEDWAVEAVRMVRENSDSTRECQREQIVKAGYDLDALVKWYQDYFTRIITG